MDPASVDFRLAQGRVYHRGLEFRIGDVVVRSEGSVGFDESLSVELQLPIQDKWVEREPLLSGLRGQSIQIPVRGTMSRPEIDNRFVADLSTRLLRVTAEQAITEQIQGGLERLFRRRK